MHGVADEALIDMGDFAGGMLKYVRQHPVPNITIAGGFAKLVKLAQGALDLHSARSQVDMEWLAGQVADLALNQNMSERIRNANTAAEVLELTQSAGIDLAKRVAELARQTAIATLRDAPVSVEIIVVDREGKVLACAT